MSNITNDILTAINSNLSAEVGTLLKQRLEQAESLESDNERYLSRIKKHEATIEEYKTQLLKCQDEIAQHKALHVREAECKQREIELELTLCKRDLTNAQLMINKTTELFATVFKNPVAKETITRSSLESEYPSGQYDMKPNLNKTETTTKLTETE